MLTHTARPRAMTLSLLAMAVLHRAGAFTVRSHAPMGLLGAHTRAGTPRRMHILSTSISSPHSGWTRASSTTSVAEAHPLAPLHLLHSPEVSPEDRQRAIAAGLANGSICAMRVKVHPQLRDHLKMSKRDRTGRIFVPREALQSMQGLREALCAALRIPVDVPLALSTARSLPGHGLEEGMTITHHTLAQFSAATTAATTAAQRRQEQEREQEQEQERRGDQVEGGLVKVLISADPTAEWPPVSPLLRDMPEPGDATHIQMLSFYRFAPIGDPVTFAEELADLWSPLGVQGRVYTAQEGINAQIAVPANVYDHFTKVCAQHAYLAPITLNPDVKVSVEEYDSRPAFRALHVRPRERIVADGLEEPLDLTDDANAPLDEVHMVDGASTGVRLSPEAWHRSLDPSSEAYQSDAVVLDCRNTYESDIGRFKGAIPLNTTTFRESWDSLDTILKDTPKDTPLMTYCTGGIRCVKIGAYLSQRLGFTNVNRLEGGVVNYTRHVRETYLGGGGAVDDNHSGIDADEGDAMRRTSLFEGLNYVFNDRMVEEITDDVPVSDSPERRAIEAMAIVQERKAAAQGSRARGGAASSAGGTGAVHTITQSDVNAEELEEYASAQSGAEPELLSELCHATRVAMPMAAHMVSGNLQGQLLRMLCRMVDARRVLELGTFTGYATLCFAEAVAVAAASASSHTSASHPSAAPRATPAVTTLELDTNAAKIAQRYFDMSEHGHLIDLRVGDAMKLMPELCAAASDGAVEPYDVVFIDADKRKYHEYLDMLLDSCLVRPGSIVLVDNVLWKGKVLGIAKSGVAPEVEERGELDKATRRDRILTQAMHEFNVKVRKEPRLEQVVLPLRDGLSIMRVRG